jgi:hypothetical protein
MRYRASRYLSAVHIRASPAAQYGVQPLAHLARRAGVSGHHEVTLLRLHTPMLFLDGLAPGHIRPAHEPPCGPNALSNTVRFDPIVAVSETTHQPALRATFSPWEKEKCA